jgi:hypothetical protein
VCILLTKNNHVTVLEEKLFKYVFRIGRSKSKEGIGKVIEGSDHNFWFRYILGPLLSCSSRPLHPDRGDPQHRQQGLSRRRARSLLHQEAVQPRQSRNR